jgi:acyl-CoA synthetase (AMP-forming)/AMP-acid ligase II/3-hydroxymyristoyl/3-hydroxydecanoyl-(acyl carrier protein) dehydratase
VSEPTTMAALLSPSLLHRPAVIGGEHDWTWHEIHAAARELADRLHPDTPVCNLCASRAGFLITALAALRRGCLQLLPPSGGLADLVALLGGTPGAMVVVDDETLLQPVSGARTGGLVYLPQVPRHLPSPRELAWTPEARQTCVRLYTSGSTGAPQPHAKTWGQLTQGARALAARLDTEVHGGLAALRALVCSVPPQHMFGFESSVMLPLATGLAVLDRKPLLPLDVRTAVEQCGGPTAWIATPLHLRALARAGETLPDCRLALVSTMPLAATLAAQVEALVSAPVVEIFGSTETGVIATRRTATQASWQPIGDVRLEHGADGTLARGTHFPSPHTLADRVEIAGDGRFTLLGRHADMVKIGGRRASLSGLNLLLQDLPGLEDGVFYLPAEDAPTERLVLIHAGQLDRAAAERWLRERIDVVFLPRSWLQVERLPRDANGKLPRAALEALHAAQRTTVAAAPAACSDHHFRVAASHPSLPGHFPGRPVVPGVLILDHVLVGVRERTGRDVARLPRVKFASPLLPEESARVQFTQREGSLSFRVSALRDGVHQAIAEGSVVLAPLAEASP